MSKIVGGSVIFLEATYVGNYLDKINDKEYIYLVTEKNKLIGLTGLNI